MKLNKKALVLACCGILSIGLYGCKSNPVSESSSPRTEHSNTNNDVKDSEGVDNEDTNNSGNKANNDTDSSNNVNNDVNTNTNNSNDTNNKSESKKENKKETSTDVVDKNATKNNDTSDDSSQYTQDEIENMFDYEDGRGEEDR